MDTNANVTTPHAPNPRAIEGGNRPPIAEVLVEAVEGIDDRLLVEFDAIIIRSAELMAAFGRVPEVLDDNTAPKVADQIAQITAHSKAADAFREAAVAPALKAQRSINGFFDKHVFDSLDQTDKKRKPGAKQMLTARLTVYETAKADAERKRREEEAAKAAAAAAEAERLQKEAERKAAEAAEAERQRIAAEENRIRLAREAEERRVAEEQRKADEAAAAAAKAIKDAADLDEAIRLEAIEKVAREKREAEAKIAREKAEAEAAERARIAAAEAEQARIKREAEAKVAKEAADRAAAEAAKTRASAAAKASELHTVRGDYGASSSLSTHWKGFLVDREKLLANAADIWPYISDDELQKFVNGFVKTNKGSRKLAGVDIREVTQAQVRG